MKFTVEVEGFWIEEGDLAEELKKEVKADVVRQMKEHLKTQVDAFMDNYIKKELSDQLQGRIQAAMDDFLANGKLKDSYNKSNEMTVAEWLSSSLKGRSGDITKTIENQVKKAVAELQNRYDILFASQLITKINGQGFLKEDVAKLLLSPEGKS